MTAGAGGAGLADLRAAAPLVPVFVAFVLAYFGLRTTSSVRTVEALRPLAEEACRTANLADPNLLLAVVHKESKGNPAAVSSARAFGLTQLKLAAAEDASRALGMQPPTAEELLEPAKNLTLGAAYLKLLLDRYNNAVDVALAAYFKGPGWVSSVGGAAAVRRWLQSPSEVTRYVTGVLELSARLRVRSAS